MIHGFLCREFNARIKTQPDESLMSGVNSTGSENDLGNHFCEIFKCYGVRLDGNQCKAENEWRVTYSCMIRDMVGLDEDLAREAGTDLEKITKAFSPLHKVGIGALVTTVYVFGFCTAKTDSQMSLSTTRLIYFTC